MSAKSHCQGGFAEQAARITVVLVLLLGAAFVPTGTARALAFTVNTATDTVDAVLNGVCADSLGNCSLRAAIMEANASPGSTITFAPALNGTAIRLTISGAEEDAALSGDLDINVNMTITGNGPANIIIQGAADASYTGSIGEKIFGVNDSRTLGTPIDVSFSGMTIRYGDNQIALAGNGGIGGGISIYQSGDGSSASITDCVIEYNRVQHNYGGGVLFYTGTGATNSSLTVTNVTFRGNQTLGGASGTYWSGGALRVGGLASTVTISGSTFEDNSTPSAGLIMSNDGGAISFSQTSSGGSLEVGNSTFSGNSSRAGGAIAVDTGSVAAAINVNIHDSEFTGNEAGEAGGALHFSGSSFTSVTLTEVDISENQAGTYGGGVYVDDMSVTLVHSRIAKNTAPANPLSNGLYKTNEATATVTATRNWWGCSTGPGATPCDRAFSAGGGTLTYSPWLRNLLTSGTTLVTNQTSALTASFLTDSAGGAVTPPLTNLGQIIGLPISWGASSGSASGAATVGAGGTASGTFQATAVGSATVYARVDNDNTAPASSNVLSFTVNKANTATAITSDLPDPSMAGQAVTVTFTVTGEYGNSPTAPTGSVTVSDGTVSCTGTIAAGSCNLTFTTPGTKNITATYAGDANFNASTSPVVIHVVNALPTVTGVSSTAADGAYTVGEIIPITVTFSMPVTVEVIGGTPQLTLETGTMDRVVNYSSGSGTATLTFNYTVQAGDTSTDLDYGATTSLALNGGTIRDVTDTYDAILTLASPGALGSLGANKAIVIDTTAPTVTSITSTTANGAYTVGEIIPITVTFSELVNVNTTGGTPHLTLETGAVDEGIYYTGGSGTNTLTFTYTVQTGDNSPDLDYIATTALSANGGTIQDAATNNAVLTLPAPGAVGSLGANKAIVIDTTAPTVTMSSAAPNPTNTSPIPVTVQFSETVTGFVAADITPTNATVGGFVIVDGDTYTFDLIPSGQGLVTADIAAGIAVDAAGNGNAAAAQFSRTYDTTAPTVAMNSAAPNPTNTSPIPVTVQFSETVTGFVATDITPGNGTVNNFVAVDGDTYAFNLIPSGQGLVTADIAAGVAVDAAGNGNAAAPQFSRTYDTTAPTVAMSSAAPNPTNTSPIPVTVQFSETVTGFLATDITPTNATVGGFVAVDGDTYTFNLIPGGQGLVAADIAAGVAVDAAGNSNAAAPQFSRTFDNVLPDTTIDSQPANPSNSANAVFTFSGTDNLTPPASLTFQCSLDGAAFGACPVNYTGLADVSHTFQVRAVDQAGNNDPTPASYTWVVDTTPPNTTITSIPSNPTSSTTAIFAFTGNDGGGTGVTSYACNLDGGGFFPCTSSWTYNGLGDGSHTFQVQATDAANNTDATPASFTWVVDTSSPSVAVSSAATSPTNDPTFSITVTFSEDVTGFTPSTASGDLVIVNGTASNPGGSGAIYTFDLSPSGQGPVTVRLPAGSGQDAAGNGNIVSNLFSITYDSVAPTVTIAPAAGQLDPTSGSPINFTATFSETVTGFGLDVTDVTVSGTAGATTAAVTGSGTTYNVAVSGMTGGGTVIVSISAGSAQDAAGNGNSASGNATVTFTPLGITSPNNLTFVAGNLSSFTITTTGAPPPTLTYTFRPPTVTLPSGIGFVDNLDGTATLSGTPALGSVGTYYLTFTASNGVGPDATQDFTLTIDGPPGVARINSSADTGDGQIDENEHTSVAITQLLVVFNKAMNADTPADLDDALNVENYSLVRDGSTTITIDSISYNPATFTATLNINAAFAPPLAGLQNGQYTLTVEWDIEDTLGVPIGTDFVRVFYVDNGAPALTSVVTIQGGTAITNGATINVRFSSLDITFNEDVSDPAGNVDPDDVTNVENYLLVTPGPNGVFDTSDCLLGLGGDDLAIPVGPVSYTNHGGTGPFVATVQLNNGTTLPNGIYQLFICGTTSIVDLAGNPLNGGADDRRTFTVLVTARGGGSSARRNPQTGFAPGVVTLLPEQPAAKAYADLGDLWIEIPRLGLKTSITGVPLTADGWDVTWLNHQVGWLEGTAYPTWEGNTVLTAHGYTADGNAGPFALLKDLSYGETIVIHLGGMKYTYAVRANLLIRPSNTYWLTKHEELDWVTLITCQQYDEKTRSYRYRRVVRAVLIKVEEE